MVQLFRVEGSLAALSVAGSFSIILSFFLIAPLRRHPTSLVFWMSLCDFMYSMKYLATSLVPDSDELQNHAGACITQAVIGQFFGLASISFNGMITLNLLRQLKNPFADTASSAKFYHVYVWTLSAVTTAVMLIKGNEDGNNAAQNPVGIVGPSGDGTCWIASRSTGSTDYQAWRLLFFLPMGLYVLSGAAALVAVALRQKSLMQQLGNDRAVVNLVRRMALYVVMFMLAWSGPSAHRLAQYMGWARAFPPHDADPTFLEWWDVIGVSLYGFLNAIVWLSNPTFYRVFTKNVLVRLWGWFTSGTGGDRVPLLSKALTDDLEDDRQDFQRIDYLLRKYVITSILSGIHTSVRRRSRARSVAASQSAPPGRADRSRSTAPAVADGQDAAEAAAAAAAGGADGAAGGRQQRSAVTFAASGEMAMPVSGTEDNAGSDSGGEEGAAAAAAAGGDGTTILASELPAPPRSRSMVRESRLDFNTLDTYEFVEAPPPPVNAAAAAAAAGDDGLGAAAIKKKGRGKKDGAAAAAGVGGGDPSDRLLGDDDDLMAGYQSTASAGFESRLEHALGPDAHKHDSVGDLDQVTEGGGLGMFQGGYEFYDYAPETFRQIRALTGISDHEYLESLETSSFMDYLEKDQKFSEGRSGSFFCFSPDKKLIIKTVPEGEAILLRQILPNYLRHMKTHPDSLIIRFFGCHAVRVQGLASSQLICVVVMQNVYCTSLKIHERYDLKGSWVRRKVGLAFEQNPRNVLGMDLDLQRKLMVTPNDRTELLRLLATDATFLRDQGIMDYSLLLGFHFFGADDDQVALDVSSGDGDDDDVDDDVDGEDALLMSEDEDAAGAAGRRSSPSSASAAAAAAAAGPTIPPMDDSRPFWSRCDGGLLSTRKDEIYFLGVIDILQAYNASKKRERCCKVYFLRKDKRGVSVQNPTVYCTRFMGAMAQHLIADSQPPSE